MKLFVFRRGKVTGGLEYFFIASEFALMKAYDVFGSR